MILSLFPARRPCGTFIIFSLFGLCTAALPAHASLTIATIASFTGQGAGTNGGYPSAGVTFDSSGNLFGTTYKGGASGYGTVFEIAKGTNTVTDIASFNGTQAGTNGGLPNAGVTFDSSGNLFGTTQNGGASGNGTVYEIANGTNTITTLASFNVANGGLPYAGVTLDSSGNLFGTTYKDGTFGYGTVYEIANGTNTITDIASFTGGGAGTNGGLPYAGVTLDSNGNLFGTTFQGGASGYGTVYEIANGTNIITDIASFNVANGSNPRGGVTFDSSGNIFGTTVNGGAAGNGTVYEIAKGTNTITTLFSFNGTGNNSGHPDGDVIFDSSGNIVGTSDFGGTYGVGAVYEIAGVGSATAAPEPSQLAALGLTTLGLGELLLRARKRRQPATLGA